MQVILQETVKNLGLVGDVVNVAPGYFRNYLAPRSLALLANPKSLKMVEHQKRLIDAKKAKAKEKSQQQKMKLETSVFSIEHAAGAGDKLFGSITSQEITLKINEQGFDIDRKLILLDQPLKTVGDHVVKIKLHPEVVAEVKIAVKAKETPKEDREEAAPKKSRRKKEEPKEEVTEEVSDNE
ncbi:50S ribosomal protein L9 [bacterium]|nr:50S ribosomal protein L9 [bacterium]